MSAVPPSAFDAFFADHVDFVVRSLQRLGVHRRDVEDVAQEVFVVAMRRSEPLDPGWSPRAYLWAVARRQAADYRRLARHRADLGEPPDREAETRGSLEVVELVHRALERLPEERRDVLVLFEIEGLTLEEIAVATSAPANTVSSRLRKARQEFENAIRALDEDAKRREPSR